MSTHVIQLLAGSYRVAKPVQQDMFKVVRWQHVNDLSGRSSRMNYYRQ